MPRFQITVEQTLTVMAEIEVEADDLDEAERLAVRECQDGAHDETFLTALRNSGVETTEYESVGAEEMDDEEQE